MNYNHDINHIYLIITILVIFWITKPALKKLWKVFKKFLKWLCEYLGYCFPPSNPSDGAQMQRGVFSGYDGNFMYFTHSDFEFTLQKLSCDKWINQTDVYQRYSVIKVSEIEGTYRLKYIDDVCSGEFTV